MSQAVLFGAEQSELTSDDYYTPAWVFERMGIEFDLDPCAPPGGGRSSPPSGSTRRRTTDSPRPGRGAYG